MKKILMIAYHFPPFGGSGAQRIVKFIKYLPGFGWEPIIVTVKKVKNYNFYNDRLAKELPLSTKIFKTAEIDMLFGMNRVLKKIQKNENMLIAKIKSSDLNKDEFFVFKFKRALFDFFIAPDEKIGWLFFGIWEGLMAIRAHEVDIIYSTSPPITAHLIAYILKKITKKPLVVDFRDPWQSTLKQSTIILRKKIDSFLEKRVIESADKVVVNTERVRIDFLNRYPSLDKDKFVVITNGYDSDDFLHLEKGNDRKERKFTISHTGEFYHEVREPINFLIAIDSLIKEKKIYPTEISINFVGDEHYVKSESFLNRFYKLNLNGVVNFINHVSHEQSIQYLYSSDVLLLLQPSIFFRMQIPAKAYEYIRANKYILTLAPEGATSDLIKSTSLGIIVDPDNIESIKHEIYRLFLKYKQGSLNSNLENPISKKFERKKLTEQLVLLFEDVLGERLVEKSNFNKVVALETCRNIFKTG